MVPEFYQDEWIHAVGTVDMDSGTASLYIDGEFIGEQPISSTEDFIQLGLGNEQSKSLGVEALWYRAAGNLPASWMLVSGIVP